MSQLKTDVDIYVKKKTVKASRGTVFLTRCHKMKGIVASAFELKLGNSVLFPIF